MSIPRDLSLSVKQEKYMIFRKCFSENCLKILNIHLGLIVCTVHIGNPRLPTSLFSNCSKLHLEKKGFATNPHIYGHQCPPGYM